jgi:hypothetical protein
MYRQEGKYNTKKAKRARYRGKVEWGGFRNILISGITRRKSRGGTDLPTGRTKEGDKFAGIRGSAAMVFPGRGSEKPGLLHGKRWNGGVIEYYERKAFGRHTDAFRLFLYKVTRDLIKEKGDTRAFLRTTMGAMTLFGVPPEKN